VPAAAVIPAPIAYIKVVAFKTLVVEVCSWVWYFIAVCFAVGIRFVQFRLCRAVPAQATAIAIYSLLLLAAG
jgi:hypothetical protein